MVYPDAPNPDILSRIPSDAKVVLDVGCFTGALGGEYKRRNPLAKVFGIERDKTAGDEARRRLDGVYITDLDTNQIPFEAELSEGSIDCLIYGDILEHVRDPASVLRRHVDFLAPDGIVIICCPNLEHWSFAARLLRGVWDYEDQGLLDKTHLRWFTKNTMRRMLRSINLVPIDDMPRVFDADECEEFVNSIAPGTERLGIDTKAYQQRSLPLQHVWRACRVDVTERLTVVSTMLSPVGGVSEVRVSEPMEALKSDSRLSTSVIMNSDDVPLDVEGPKVFIFHRPVLAGATGLERIKALISQGWVVVCEFDDHPDYIPVLQRQDVLNFRGVHAIQTTTTGLANIFRKQNPETAIFENAISALPIAQNFQNVDRISLLFAGINREGDWRPYVESLNALSRRFDGRLNYEIVSDRLLFDALETNHKTFTPLCDYPTYRNILSRCEISFMPLSDTPFNRCKSDLKYIEAAAYRVAALASPVGYEHCIDDGESGILFRTPIEFERCLSILVANPDFARKIGDGGRRYVERSRMLSYQVRRRADWYLSLWARREALTRSLLARVPGLG